VLTEMKQTQTIHSKIMFSNERVLQWFVWLQGCVNYGGRVIMNPCKQSNCLVV